MEVVGRIKHVSRMSVVVAFAVMLAVTGPARATWSIIAVDRATGEVGIAGASCTFNVQGIAEVVPGVGAIAVQAMSSDEAREHGLTMMRDGATPFEIVEAMRDERFDPENQQYAVIVLAEGEPATYSGEEISDWNGSAIGDGVSVQGNILADRAVVTDALAAFEKANGKPLTERLVAAMAAGARAGGDRRCGKQHARSAFVTVYRRDDNPRWPYFHMVVYGCEKAGVRAVERLAQEFDRWKEYGTKQKSTRLYILP
jgi:uncharacterized Ntn-hydrolase superfamily protein